MAVLPITVLGSPVLRQVTTPVTEVTDELRQLASDMFETMRAAEGVGLAAPQVGRTERLCVVEVGEVSAVLINPRSSRARGESSGRRAASRSPKCSAGWNAAPT